MRLEDGEEPPTGEALARRHQDRAHLRWVVGVLVHHSHTRRLAHELEAPYRAAVRGDPRTQHVESDAASVAGRDAGQRVRYVMSTWQHCLEAPEGCAAVPDSERHAALGRGRDLIRLPIGGFLQRIRLDLRRERHRIEQLPHTGAVGTGDDAPVRLHLREKLPERLGQLIERAVDVQVVRLQVRHHREVRRILEKRSVILVRLNDNLVAVARRGVRAQVAHFAADKVGRRVARSHQHGGDEAGRGCLAMAAGHADRGAPLHQLRDELGALEQRDASTSCFCELWVVLLCRGRRNHELRIRHMLGTVPLEDGDAHRSQRVGQR